METITLSLIRQKLLRQKTAWPLHHETYSHNVGGKTNVSNTKLINAHNADVGWKLQPFGLNPQIQTWLNFKSLLLLSSSPQRLLPFMITLSIAPASMCAPSVPPNA